MTEDPLEARDVLKSATIYRSSEFNYIYVCYHCECIYTNIVDTLNHIETHFDVKVNIVNDNLGVNDNYAATVCESHIFEADERNRLVVVDVNPMTFGGEDNGHLEFEQKYKYCEDYDKDVKVDFNEVSNQHLSQCRLCDQTFSAPPPLIIHIMKCHAKIPTFTCPECSQNWIDETLLMSHLQQHIDDNDTTYDALIDKVNSKCEEAVKIEIEKCPRRRYKKKRLKTCDICSATFTTKEKIISHMREQHIKQSEVKKYFFDCEKCKRKIEGTKFAFYAHQHGHLTNDDRINVAVEKNLRKYLDESISCDESNPNKITFGCTICGDVSLKHRSGVQRHILQRHIHLLRSNKSEDKQFACEYCGRKFALSKNLVVHKRIHSLEKPFTCSTCNKSFAHSNLLKYHENIHKGIQPHQCSICGHRFRSVSKLNFHMKCHSNITTKCTICNKELKSHRLKIHIRNVHENEHRPYKCTVCLKPFKTAKTLKIHSYRHSGEKKFECRLHCKETFVSSSSRRAHERSKHEVH